MQLCSTYWNSVRQLQQCYFSKFSNHSIGASFYATRKVERAHSYWLLCSTYHIDPCWSNLTLLSTPINVAPHFHVPYLDVPLSLEYSSWSFHFYRFFFSFFLNSNSLKKKKAKMNIISLKNFPQSSTILKTHVIPKLTLPCQNL